MISQVDAPKVDEDEKDDAPASPKAPASKPANVTKVSAPLTAKKPIVVGTDKQRDLTKGARKTGYHVPKSKFIPLKAKDTSSSASTPTPKKGGVPKKSVKAAKKEASAEGDDTEAETEVNDEMEQDDGAEVN